MEVRQMLEGKDIGDVDIVLLFLALFIVCHWARAVFSLNMSS